MVAHYDFANLSSNTVDGLWICLLVSYPRFSNIPALARSSCDLELFVLSSDLWWTAWVLFVYLGRLGH